MPFTFRGNDLTLLLAEPLRAPASLLVHLGQANRAVYNALDAHWTSQRGAKPARDYASVKGAFSALEGWWSKDYDDANIVASLYRNEQAAALLQTISGCNSAATFMERFEDARNETFLAFVQPLSLLTLAKRSFQMTYLHKDIAELFRMHAHSTDAKVMKKRVVETAEIMLRILYGNMNGAWRLMYGTRTFVTAALLGIMHNKLLRADTTYRGNAGGAIRYYYNQSSVGFTLLTFCGVVHSVHMAQKDGSLGLIFPEAKKMKLPDPIAFPATDWYFIWKVVGSLMGLSLDIIPNNFDESEALMTTFEEEGETLRDMNEVRGLLAAFDGLDIGVTDLLSWAVTIKWQEFLDIMKYTGG